MIVIGINRKNYNLTETPLASGGEGDIYEVIDTNLVAKIYKPDVLSAELEIKLAIMIQRPPDETIMSQVAWPLDMAYDERGQLRGFIMQKMSINSELGEIYKYPSEFKISILQKINIAKNICAVISEVHKEGYVFGDFNPRNIGLDTKTGLVSFLDTDTYHVTDPATGGTFRCVVCAPGYVAPELLDKCSEYTAKSANEDHHAHAYAHVPLPTFTMETDNFALAIHIFKLLMNGYTPFGGIIETASASQSSPGVGDMAVRRDSYCFRPGYKAMSVAIPPLEALPEEIADLFNRAFIDGRENPQNRPNAVMWHRALTRFERDITVCANNSLHHYDKKNKICPYCEADKRYQDVTSADYVSGSAGKSSPVAVPPPTPLPTKQKDTSIRTESGRREMFFDIWAERVLQKLEGKRKVIYTAVVVAALLVLLLVAAFFAGRESARISARLPDHAVAIRFSLDNPIFTINGNPQAAHSSPLIYDGEFMLSIDTLAYIMDASVVSIGLAGEEQTAIFSYGNRIIQIPIGEPLPNDMGIAIMVEDNIYIPFPFAAGIIGGKMHFAPNGVMYLLLDEMPT